MEFTPGKFEKLRVVKAFHFGPLQQDLRLDQKIEFDGNVVRMGSKDHDAPQLIAAVRAGWLVLEGTVGGETMKPAAVQIRPAQSVGNNRGEATNM
ncbi:MAG: hypothetical protein WCO84_06250, partial [bacterium]